MQERRYRSRTPLLAIITMVAVVVSIVLWQNDRNSNEVLVESQATITEVNYVRTGSVMNAAEVSAKFETPDGSRSVTFTEIATDRSFIVGDKLEISFPVDSPTRGVPTYRVTNDSPLSSGQLMFTILVGFVAVIAMVFARNESCSRLGPRLPTESAAPSQI